MGVERAQQFEREMLVQEHLRRFDSLFRKLLGLLSSPNLASSNPA
jgi:hypothetical protein